MAKRSWIEIWGTEVGAKGKIMLYKFRIAYDSTTDINEEIFVKNTLDLLKFQGIMDAEVRRIDEE